MERVDDRTDRPPTSHRAALHSSRPTRGRLPPTLLSARHERVLALRGRGLSLKVIGIELGLGPSTVCDLLGVAQRSLNLARWEIGGPESDCRKARRRARLEALCLGLTPAEADVLRLVAAGWSNAEIAAFRRRACRTVVNQIAKAFRKIGLRYRVELFSRLGE